MQYKSVGVSNVCTVGVQNAAGGQGLQLAFNQNYVQNNLCVALSPTPWLGLSANAGLVPKANADTVNVSLNAAGLGYGTYQATLLLATSDSSQSLVSLPVMLSVTAIGTWRQTHFGVANNSGDAADTADPDHDGLINILEYAFNSNPLTNSPSPLTFGFVNGLLTITFKRAHPAPPDIGYVFEVTDNFASGTWHSGPAYTSLAVTDNFDGTETVALTDLAPSSSMPAHYLRVRISSP